MNEINKNPNSRTELGFGQYKDKKICDFNNDESGYLLWALKTVRIPKPLWEAILEHLETKVILHTKTVITDKSSLTDYELERFAELIKLDKSQFLEPRIDPNIYYKCDRCNNLVYGYPDAGYISDIIKCNDCHSQLKLDNSELRFYFGWYRGWRISDFEISKDKEYLEWIIENIESLTPNFKQAILNRLKE